MGIEPLCEVGEKVGIELEAGGGAVAAEGGEALGTGGEGLEEVETGHGAGGALADAVVEGDNDGGSVVGLGEAAGDDADHAGVPAFFSEDDGAAATETALGVDHGMGLVDHERSTS